MPQIYGVAKKNLKHFKFWKYFYWKHDKATLRVKGMSAKYRIIGC